MSHERAPERSVRAHALESWKAHLSTALRIAMLLESFSPNMPLDKV